MRSTLIPIVAVSCAALALLESTTGPVSSPLRPQTANARVRIAEGAPAPLRSPELTTADDTALASRRVAAIEAPPRVEVAPLMDPIDPWAEALLLPTQLVLQADASDELLQERYESERTAFLVRQQVRLERLVQGQYNRAALPPLQLRVVDGLLRDVDALNRELGWLQSATWARMHADDPGFRLLAPESAADLSRALQDATREDLRVTEWQLDRQRILEENRACDLLIHQGRYVDEPAMVFT